METVIVTARLPLTLVRHGAQREVELTPRIRALIAAGKLVVVGESSPGETPEESYADLQAIAKTYGIKANQSREALVEAIQEAREEDANGEAVNDR